VSQFNLCDVLKHRESAVGGFLRIAVPTTVKWPIAQEKGR